MLKFFKSNRTQVDHLKPIAAAALLTVDLEYFQDISSFSEDTCPNINFSNFQNIVKPTSFQKFSSASLSDNHMKDLNNSNSSYFLCLNGPFYEVTKSKSEKILIQNQCISGEASKKLSCKSILRKGQKCRFS